MTRIERSLVPVNTEKWEISRVCLGGTVFGWSTQEKDSFKLLDFYCEQGGNFIDTSDFYSEWAPGNRGGESETIIGKWINSRGIRERVLVATKFGLTRDFGDFTERNISRALDGSLRRLRTDFVDIYLSHVEVPNNAQLIFAETMLQLQSKGKIRTFGLSHNSVKSLRGIAKVLEENNSPTMGFLQTNLNIIERESLKFEIPFCNANGINVLAARPLAGGFLSGKYKLPRNLRYLQILYGLTKHFPSAGLKTFSRGYRATLPADAALKYASATNMEIVRRLEVVAQRYGVSAAAVATSWVLDQSKVSSIVVSFRSRKQVIDGVPILKLDVTDRDFLDGPR